MEERDFAGIPGRHAPLALRHDRLGHVLPYVTVRVLAGGGHFPLLDRPERFTRCPAVTAQLGKAA